MSSVVDQVTHALASRRSDLAKTLLDDALANPQPTATHVQLLELRAQSQAELESHSEAASTWEHAYDLAPTSADKWRLFEHARRAYQQLHDHPALQRLAQAQLPHATTAQDRANCLLVAGQAAYHLSQYAEARRQYLEPALKLQGVAPDTRVYLYHHLGLCHMNEHDFTAAAGAFRCSAEIASSIQLTQRSTRRSAQGRRWDQLVNAALFYQGVIHLLHHRPHQAQQLLQRIQHPATQVDGFKTAFYLALAHRDLHLPDAAERVLQPLRRARNLPDFIQTPLEVVCAGVANLNGESDAAGPYLEAALEAPIPPAPPWEPSWRVLLYQELGLAFLQRGARHAAIASYEESLKLAVYRIGDWQEPSLRQWLRGASLLIALDNLPLHTWSTIIRGEMVRSLQALARVYTLGSDGVLADTALSLALRLAVTPEQHGLIWLQRGWLTAMRLAPVHGHPRPADANLDVILTGVQQVRDQVVGTPLAALLSGMAAWLQGDEAKALAAFDAWPELPDSPFAQAIGTSAWLWAQAESGGLETALNPSHTVPPVLWSSQMTCTLVLETLILWTTAVAAAPTSTAVSWLEPLMYYDEAQSLGALRRLTQPGYLPDPSRHVLSQALRTLATDAASGSVADAIATLLGGDVLLGRIETCLAALDHGSPPPQPAPRKASRRRKSRRRASALTASAPDLMGLRQLIQHLHPDVEAQSSPHLPDVIYQWLRRYARLGNHAPEVVGALLSLLRNCPQPQATIQAILEQIPLSKRQRQGLEATLQESQPTPDPTPSLQLWEAARSRSLTQVLHSTSDRSQPTLAPCDALTTAREWYALAVALARLGMLSYAIDCTHTCLELAPEQPRPHFLLAQMHRMLHQYATAWQHTLIAWQGLRTEPVQVLHLEVINHILVLLGGQQDYDPFPEWLATFQRLQAELEAASLLPDQQQRLREEVGECALAHVLYLSATTPAEQERETVEAQLDLLSQAIEFGMRSTQHFALHRRAELLTQYQRVDEATTTYHHLLKGWPDDPRAHLRLSLLTAMQLATSDTAAADQALSDALTLALHDVRDSQLSPLTPQRALEWLQAAPTNDPHLLDLSDVLTTYGGMAVERHQIADALALLEPLYTLQGHPLQAYYLAEAHYVKSRETRVDSDRLRECKRALAYVQQALEGGLHRDVTASLHQQAQAEYDRLTAAQDKSVSALTAYRQRVCACFRRYDIPFHEDSQHGAPDAPWLTIAEHLDLDEAGGTPVVTIRLCFNDNANSDSPQPDESTVRRYATHQAELRRLEQRYGMSSLPWPVIAYSGETVFEALFSARLGLNRDLLFVAYASPHALVRYAGVLSDLIQQQARWATDQPPPSASILSALARWATVLPLVQDRLHTLATSGPASKRLRRQLQALEAELPHPTWEARWDEFAIFRDARRYFATITGAMASELVDPKEG